VVEYASGVRASTVRGIRAVLAAVTLAAALAVAGCGGSTGPATDGPLRGGPFGAPSGGGTGTKARVGQPIAFGDERFTNHGHATLVLDRVGLRQPRHLRLVGSYAVPGTLMIGVARWPPRYRGIPPSWKHRRQVHGFRLAPGKSFNMVLGVLATTGTPCARSPGMVIYYHDPAGSYVVVDHFAMAIEVGKRDC
jgi:hypothetical protein